MLKPLIASLVLLFTFAFALAQDRPVRLLRVPEGTGALDVLREADRPRHGDSSTTPPVLVAAVCFLTGEQASGMNKICYYNCLGSPAAITVSAVQLCPMSINR